MKVLLVFPRMKYPSGDPPLGTAYIASYLRENVDGVEVKILDTTFDSSWKYVTSFIKKFKPDIIGLNAATLMLRDAFEVIKIAKENGTELAVMGGPHPTIFPERTFQECDLLDCIIAGEAEFTFTELVRRWKETRNKKDLISVPNLYIRIDGEIKKSPNQYFEPNLDKFPFPAYDLLDMKNYVNHWFQMDSVSSKLKGTNIMGSRGCPYQCKFCQPVLDKIFGKGIRYRSPQNIVEELLFLKKEYKIDSFYFTDDTVLFHKNRVSEFANLLNENNLDFAWGFNTRANLITENDKHHLRIMSKNGLKLTCIGIESGSQRMLNLYNKVLTLQQVKTAVKMLRKFGIKTRGFFIVGGPTETSKEIIRTMFFAASLKLDEAAFSVFVPMAGTYFWEEGATNGWNFKTDWDDMDYYGKSGLAVSKWEERKIKLLRNLAIITFYSHPYRWKYLWNSILALDKAKEKIKTYFIF